MKLKICALAALFFVVVSATAQESSFSERFYYEGYPSEELIQFWSGIPGEREYVFRMDDPRAWQLERLFELQRMTSLKVVVSRLPGEDTEEVWTRLAQQGVELVGFETGLPTSNEIARLNRIGFSKYIFVLSSFPQPEESERLAGLRGDVSLTFATSRYPVDRIEDGPSFFSLPDEVPLLFITDYWPAWAHKEFFNLLPNPIKIRATDTIPSTSTFRYLSQIRNLNEVTLEFEGEVSPNVWTGFPSHIPIHWISQDWVPSARSIAGFNEMFSTRSLRMTVDRNESLSQNERRRLEAVRAPLLWIHNAPVLSSGLTVSKTE